jgi:SNF2 family DNA or RNA helicase
VSRFKRFKIITPYSSLDVWGPFLVITPASTLHNWQQEVAKFVPSFKVVPYWGSPQERKILRHFWDPKYLHTKNASFHLVITSYQVCISPLVFCQSRTFWNCLWALLVFGFAFDVRGFMKCGVCLHAALPLFQPSMMPPHVINKKSTLFPT